MPLSRVTSHLFGKSHPTTTIDVRSRREETLFVAFVLPTPAITKTQRLLLDDNSHQTLRVLDVDGLDVAVELLLGVLLVVSSSANAYADSVGNALDTLLPDLLVQLRVDADISGLLWEVVSIMLDSFQLMQCDLGYTRARARNSIVLYRDREFVP